MRVPVSQLRFGRVYVNELAGSEVSAQKKPMAVSAEIDSLNVALVGEPAIMRKPAGNC